MRFVSVVLFAAAALTAPAGEQEFAARFEALQSNDFAVREHAAQALIKLGTTVLPALQAALPGAEADTAARIRRIIHEIEWWKSTVWTDRGAVDCQTGRLRWALTDITTVGVTADGRGVITWDASGELKRRSLRDGTELWNVSGLWKEREFKGSMALCEDRVLYATPQRVRAFDVADGRELWSAPMTTSKTGGSKDKVPAMLLATGDGRAIVRNGSMMYCIALQDGAELWSRDEGDQRADDAEVLPGGDVALRLNRALVRCSGKDGADIWRRVIADVPPSRRARSLWLVGGWLLTSDRNTNAPKADTARAVCYDPATGAMLWEEAGALAAATASADGKLLYLYIDGVGAKAPRRVVAVDTSTSKTLWEHPARMDNASLLADGPRLFVCEYHAMSGDIALHCLNRLTGEVNWTGDINGIVLPHSAYWQTTRLELRGNQIAVVSAQRWNSIVATFNVEDGISGVKWMSN